MGSNLTDGNRLSSNTLRTPTVATNRQLIGHGASITDPSKTRSSLGFFLRLLDATRGESWRFRASHSMSLVHHDTHLVKRMPLKQRTYARLYTQPCLALQYTIVHRESCRDDDCRPHKASRSRKNSAQRRGNVSSGSSLASVVSYW